MLQAGGYQAFLLGIAGGSRSDALADGAWSIWHSNFRTGRVPTQHGLAAGTNPDLLYGG